MIPSWSVQWNSSWWKCHTQNIDLEAIAYNIPLVSTWSLVNIESWCGQLSTKELQRRMRFSRVLNFPQHCTSPWKTHAWKTSFYLTACVRIHRRIILLYTEEISCHLFHRHSQICSRRLFMLSHAQCSCSFPCSLLASLRTWTFLLSILWIFLSVSWILLTTLVYRRLCWWMLKTSIWQLFCSLLFRMEFELWCYDGNKEHSSYKHNKYHKHLRYTRFHHKIIFVW